MATAEEMINGAKDKMVKSVEHARAEFATVRTGRASASLLDRIEVDYYGTQTPLRQLSTINVPEPRMLTVQPFDPGSIKAIEKAVMESDLGLTPSNDGKLIRLPIPQLTEERRKELVKIVRNMAEDHRVAVREIRRELVHFEPPEVGSSVSKDQSYGEVESVKAVSDVIAPLSGEVLEVNAQVVDAPETVNEDPYGNGWLLRIRIANPGEIDALLDPGGYRELLANQ